MKPAVTRCATGIATTAAMLLASASPALAASHHRTGHEPGHKPGHPAQLPAHPHDSARHFSVRGVVVGASGNHVEVLGSSGTIGSRSAHGKVVTLTMTPRTHRSARPLARASLMRSAAELLPRTGQEIVATGTVAPDGSLVTSHETTRVLPAEALVGQVTDVAADGTFTVATHDQVDGEHAERDAREGTVVSAPGVAVTGPALASGQWVVVLGEAEEHVMSAAKVYSFTAAPSLVAGAVTTVDAAARSLGVLARGHERDGEGDDGDSSSPAAVSVDASKADVVVNGVVAAAAAPAGGAAAAAPAPAPAFPSVDDRVLAVGTPGAAPGSVVATLVLDFTRADSGSVGDNEHAARHEDGHGRD